jgi:uncharacterized protein (TIGR02246 family)
MNPFTVTSRRMGLLMAAFSLCLAPLPQAMGAHATEQAIRELERKYDAAYNSRNPAAVASLYAEDARILAPDHEVINGRRAIEQYYKAEFAANPTKSETTLLEVIGDGDFPFETGTWVNRNPDGTVGYKGKHMVVWKRDGDSWRIFRETWNIDAPAYAGIDDPELRRTLEDYDRAWFRQDAALFEKLLGEDFAQIDPQGRTLARSDVIAIAKSGAVKFEVGQSSDVKARIYGDTAVVTGKWTEKSMIKGQPFEEVMQNTVVLTKIDGQWKVVSDQSTLITTAKPQPLAEQNPQGVRSRNHSM